MALKTKTVTTSATTLGAAAALFASAKKVRQVILEPEHDNSDQIFLTLPDEDGDDTLAFVMAQPGAATVQVERLVIPGPEVPVQDGIDLSAVKLYVGSAGDGVRVSYLE